jgi:hypothetical protein
MNRTRTLLAVALMAVLAAVAPVAAQAGSPKSSTPGQLGNHWGGG